MVEGQWEGIIKVEITLFYNLVSKLASHLLCHILFVRSKLLDTAHTQEEGITKRQECQEGGTIGSDYRNCLLQGYYNNDALNIFMYIFWYGEYQVTYFVGMEFLGLSACGSSTFQVNTKLFPNAYTNSHSH